MLIFHKFKSADHAKDFVVFIKAKFKLEAHFCKSHEEVDKYDIFPYKLTPPMAVVQRTSYKREAKIARYARVFNGEFAGT